MEKKMEEMNLEQLDEVSGGTLATIAKVDIDLASQIGKLDEVKAMLANFGLDITKIDWNAFLAKLTPLLAQYKEIKKIPTSEIIELAKAFIR